MDPVVRALALSLLLHVTLLGILELAVRNDWARRYPLLRWVREALLAPKPLDKQALQPAAKAETTEQPMLFVDIDPELVEPEPPPKAKFYSMANTRAANPVPSDGAEMPTIDGTQTHIVKTFDTLAPPPTTPPAVPQEEIPPPKEPPAAQSTPAAESKPSPPKPIEPKPAEPVRVPEGTLTFAKIDPKLKPSKNPLAEATPRAAETPPDTPRLRPRPRTVAEARMQKGIVVSPRMRHEGGVSRIGRVALDVKGTSFGAYDAAVVAAVQRRWYDLLEERKYASDSMGRVVLEFRLNADGSVTDMKTALSEVGDLLALYCQRAVLDPNPYAPWPIEMRREVGASYREVRFTFHYQ
jgi:outer membrane biosynthesis protein TonB